MRIAIAMTQVRPEDWLHSLQDALPQAEVSVWQPGAPPADYAVVWAPTQDFIDEQGERLQALFNIGAGVDGLLRLKLPPGLQVVRLDDAGMAVQMAEYVTQTVVRYFRDLDGCARNAAESRWAFFKPRERAEFTVGILGMGVLGQRVARALRHFDYPVNGYSRTLHAVDGVRGFAGEAELGAFLNASRVLVNLLPLTPDTQDILNRQTLGRLQPRGYLINVARGAHLVEADLLAWLDSGHLAGATLDVFRTEPLPPEHPFWTHPQITLTPHTSARTLRDESIAQIAGKIRALEAGQPIAGVVDPVRGY